MAKPSINDFEDLLIRVKQNSHDLNRLFFSGVRNQKVRMKSVIQHTWVIIHEFRIKFTLTNEKKADRTIQKMAGQLSRMRNLVLDEEFNPNVMEKEYLVFRRFVEQFEKNIVRMLYFDDVGVWSEKIGGLPWAAKLADKSEVTIRRYIFAKKIKAYKIIKKWWIPYEEIQNILKEK